MKRTAFIVPARDKEKHVAATVRSVLAQTEPCTIYLSDQGSTDATRAVLCSLGKDHVTHHVVHLLDCPHTDERGMPGLNAHLNWLADKVEEDFVVMCSADDLNHPDRVRYVQRAFLEYNPSYVNTGVQYLDAAGLKTPTYTEFANRASRWLEPTETVRQQIGSCGSSAWARDLWTPLVGYEQQDMILPCMALAERGIYYVDLPLHTYIHHAGLENTGFQGQIAAARDLAHRAQIVEVNNFAHVRNWTRILQRWREHPSWEKLAATEGLLEALTQKITECSYAWAYAREALILDGVPRL